ncbi:MAG: hypothetical protein H6713_35840 [Myxococcales bacterium]|nr:hypothetical protein [Myxococcales bacterium]
MSSLRRARPVRVAALLPLLLGAPACGDDLTTSTGGSDSETGGEATDGTTAGGATTAVETTQGSSPSGTETDSGGQTTDSTTAGPETSSGTTDTPGTTSGTTGISGTSETGDSETGIMPGCMGPDEDGDGVPDECDLCPGGDDGLDGDGDGVPDGCDLCPDGDDELDGDGDGQPDACDPCPADNPDDTDGDGVCDSDDLCPEGDDAIDIDDDGIPDACDDDVSLEIPGPLYDFDAADDGALVLSRHENGQVLVTCYNADLSLRKAEFVVGDYDLEPAPPPGPTVNIARETQQVIVTWHDPSGANNPSRLEYVYLDAQCDELIGESTALSGVTYVEYHSTAIDAQGNAVIAASRDDTRVTFIDSAGEITSQQIAFDLAGTTYGTHVAMNQSTGEGIISAQPHSGGTLYYRRFNADGTWQDPGAVAVSVNQHYWYDGHTVGMNDSGQFVLLWRSSDSQLDFRVFDGDGSVLADVQRATPAFEGGTPFDSFRRRHSEIQLRGENFVLGETYRSKPVDLDIMHFEYTPDGSLVVEDSTDISVAMVLAIRVTPGGRTYLHDGQTVYALTSYP